ncbi:hypothetical protein ASF58_00775 [Methylobacterium sp. Leaf125]|nr:hypothetical protein ASF58_00775 [Methylobacterium sp. Leaf125]
MLREHRRCALKITRCLLNVAIGLLLGLVPASAQLNMRKFLEGHWVGEDLQIRVDQDAVQANDNPDKPFEWSPLVIKNVTGGMIVFQIGARQYIGLIEGQQMTVTISGSSRSYVLTKDPKP